MGEKTKVTVMMEADDWKKFKQACPENDLTASQMVRRLVKSVIKNQPGPIEIVPPGEEEE